MKPDAAKSVAELRGKKVGALVGSTMYFALVVALGKEGLTPRDLDIVDLPVEETLAAFQRGDIDGAILPHPAIDEMIKAGAAEIMSPVDRAEKYGYSLFDACIVLEDWAKANPETLAKWVKVEEKANAYVKANEADSLATIGKALNIDAETAKAGLAVAVQPSAKEQLDTLWLGAPGSAGTGVAKAIEITAKFQKDLVGTSGPDNKSWRSPADRASAKPSSCGKLCRSTSNTWPPPISRSALADVSSR